jgi:gliding motility-associated-like protein
LGDSSISTRENIIYSYIQPGSYNVKLIASSFYGCKDSAQKIVVVGDQPKGILMDSILTRKAFSTQLQARKFDYAQYLWTPNVFLSSDTIPNPIYLDSSIDKSRKFIIAIKDYYGCIFYDTLKVFFFTKIDILAPNAFTPNGDKLNDVFRPFIIGFKELKYFKIFNRWGNTVFKTSDFKSGWDGTYKGVLQPMDTYTWVVVGVDIDGKTISKSGNFILIR